MKVKIIESQHRRDFHAIYVSMKSYNAALRGGEAVPSNDVVVKEL